MYQWRRFQFFDKVLIKEPNSDEPKADIKVPLPWLPWHPS